MIDAKVSPLAGMAAKFALQASLTLSDQATLLALPHATRFFEAGSYIMREGDTPAYFGIIVSGIVCGHKTSGYGQRQMTSLHNPEELFGIHTLYLESLDHNVQSLTRSEVVTIPLTALRDLAKDSAAIACAIASIVMVDISASRAWLLNISRRDARARVAHLLCELAVRLDRPGQAAEVTYDLPITQEQMADAVGLTSVHINRNHKYLSLSGFVHHSKSGVVIPDWNNLVDFADFNSRYLHIKGNVAPLSRN